MVKHLFILMFICKSHFAFSQRVEIYVGGNKNRFHDYRAGEGHYQATYNTGNGYSIGIGIDSIHFLKNMGRITLAYEKYSGDFKLSDGGLGSGFKTVAQVNKSVISFGIFPINFRVLEIIDFNLGVLTSGLVSNSFNGIYSEWSRGRTSTYNLQDKYNQYCSKFSFGLQSRIAYNLELSNTFSITPQYLYYFGLTNEFIQPPLYTKSMRHTFCLGIIKKIK